MTLEARIAFLAFFFLLWCGLGLIPWSIAAVLTRGRGALLALPLALAGASAAGVLVPLIGLRDATGFFLSLPIAMVGATVGVCTGIALSRRLEAARALTADAGPAANASDTLDP